MLFAGQYLKEFELNKPEKYYDGDWHILDYISKNKGKIYCTKPSVVQHIGRYGLNSNNFFNADIALDYWSWQQFIPVKLQLALYLMGKYTLLFINRARNRIKSLFR